MNVYEFIGAVMLGHALGVIQYYCYLNSNIKEKNT